MSPPSSPLRTALIGLTAHPNLYDWAGSVHLAHITSSPHYTLTALCNTSHAAGRAAISRFSLPSTIKTYDSPADVAADPDIDLVVVAVRTSLHKQLIMPSLLAGKMAFVEWPLGRTVAEAEEMSAVAKEKGLETMVGLQARQTRIFGRVKELVGGAGGKSLVGKVLSTTVAGSLLVGGGMEDKSIEYALDEASGSTIVDVHFVHFIEGFTYALDSEISTLSSLVATQRPTTSMIDKSTPEPTITNNVPKSAPDQILMHGTLASGAVVSLHFRGGSSTLDKGFRWLIYGEAGEIEITGWAPLLHINVPGITWRVRVSDAEGKVTLDEEVGDEEGQPAVGKLYEAFATGETDGFVDFDGGVVRQRIAAALKESSAGGVSVKL